MRKVLRLLCAVLGHREAFLHTRIAGHYVTGRGCDRCGRMEWSARVPTWREIADATPRGESDAG